MTCEELLFQHEDFRNLVKHLDSIPVKASSSLKIPTSVVGDAEILKAYLEKLRDEGCVKLSPIRLRFGKTEYRIHVASSISILARRTEEIEAMVRQQSETERKEHIGF